MNSVFFARALMVLLLTGAVAAAPKKNNNKSPQSPSEETRRVTLHARTTLMNSNIEDLTPEEAVFFEETWRQVYNDIHIFGQEEEEIDETTVRSVVIEEQGPSPNHRRQLRTTSSLPTSRSLKYYLYSTFDIWALIEVTCSFCGDDRRGLLEENVAGPRGGNGKSQRHFESTLCEELRNGPFDKFQGVEDCRVAYLAV
jgi:hypothetical protein